MSASKVRLIFRSGARCASLVLPLLVFGLFCLSPATLAASEWPGLRGPAYDGTARDAQLYDGPGAGLELAWKRDLGAGYSSVVVGDSRVITLFASGEHDVVAAFDAKTGEELWRHAIEPTYEGHDGSHDGPISTPALTADRVFALGARGRLVALDAATGAERWSTHLVDDHGGTKPHYGFAASLLVADGVLVVGAGAGEGRSVLGFDVTDGTLLWGLGDEEFAYQSPVVASLGGTRQILAATQNWIYGIEPRSGKALWSHEHGGDRAAMGGQTIIPIPVGTDRILLMNKNDSTQMLRVSTEGEASRVEVLWESNALKGSYVHPVVHENAIYGMTGKIFTAIDLETGERLWRSRSPGDGFPTLVGDHLVVITKPGSLHVAPASRTGFEEVARLDLFDEHSWSAVAYADGALFARSMGSLARIEPNPRMRSEPRRDAFAWVAGTEFGRFLESVSTAEDKGAAVDAYLERQSSFPIVEPTGAVHFVYRGEASDVGIVGDMIGYRREDPMERVPGTDLFYYSMRLEPDAAVSYGFLPDFGDAIADPRNERSGMGVFGPVSWFSMPAWPEPHFLREAAEDRRGRIEEVQWISEVRDEPAERTAQVYLPAGYDAATEKRYPTVYVHQGGQALQAAAMQQALDNLIGDRVEEIVAVFVPVDPANPRGDLGRRDLYTRMLTEELVPLIDGKYRTRAEALHRASFGAADGGTVALHGAFAHPEVFGKVAALSPILMSAQELSDAMPAPDEHPLVIYHGWGTYHLRAPHEAWDMVRANQELWAGLREQGYRPAGGEAPEGFGWACWRRHTADWLAALFPASDS